MNKVRGNIFKITTIILIVVVIIMASWVVSVKNDMAEIEAKQLERDVRASWSLMMTIDKELRRYQTMYDRGTIDEESLMDHQSIVRGLCNVGMKIRYSWGMDYIRNICPEGLNGVNDDSVIRYSELSEYLMSVHNGAMNDELEDEESDQWWIDYLYSTFTSEEFMNEVTRIVDQN